MELTVRWEMEKSDEMPKPQKKPRKKGWGYDLNICNNANSIFIYPECFAAILTTVPNYDLLGTILNEPHKMHSTVV